MLFLVTLHYKMCGRPAQARARPEPGPKTEARHVPWDGHEQDFLGPKNPNFFSAQPEPGLTREMLRSNNITTKKNVTVAQVLSIVVLNISF
jgi:hypothetical protein